MSCSNEEISAYLDALIKYKQSWIKPGLPEIGDDCLEKIKQRYRILKDITTESTTIDFYKESIKDLNTLLNCFRPKGDYTNINNHTNMELKIINNKKIIELQEKIEEIKKTRNLLIQQKKKDSYNHALTREIDNLTYEHNNLLDELKKAESSDNYKLGGKRKSKRRKSKNPTKKDKKNKKSMKKSMKK